MKYIITEQQLGTIFNYLSNKPYKEVASLVSVLSEIARDQIFVEPVPEEQQETVANIPVEAPVEVKRSVKTVKKKKKS